MGNSNSRGEIGRGRRGRGSVGAEPSLPDGALVSYEGADPVTSLTITKHGIVVYTVPRN